MSAAPQKETGGNLLTLTQVAARLGLAKRTVQRLIARRDLRGIRIGHGRGVWRVSEAEIQRIIAEGTPRD